ncbi:hypothetical protein [Methylorubrum populi]|uniref:hypothetical protein n=1 Tax=Methylorubrum populi TaxID=223967 RepID=UPI0012659544|nr:hypothetical protein [Methylorubrum populi]
MATFPKALFVAGCACAHVSVRDLVSLHARLIENGDITLADAFETMGSSLDPMAAALPLAVRQMVDLDLLTSPNRVRPHWSLGYRPPAPVSYPDLAFRLPMAASLP